MPLPKRRRMAALTGDGHIRLVEQDVPPLGPGAVLVEVHASLVSPGTELGGWRKLAEQRSEPAPEAKPKPFGYSNAGVVLAVGKGEGEGEGEGANDFRPGDRVAAIGNRYAVHADYTVVPHNLCVRLPRAVTFAQGSYAMLAATALHALRRGGPEFGESVAVIGLGIVGQLTAMLYRLAGNFVIGLDSIPRRIEIARRWGIDEAVLAGPEGEGDLTEAVKRFTLDRGLDAAVVAFGGDATGAMRMIEKCMKVSPDGHPTGRVVVVGGARFDYGGSLTNIDVRRASRTGPGYHHEAWELGADYPEVYMRWTTRTNLELCMRLVSEGRLEVDALTTHTVALDRVDEETSAILDDPDGALGVVFTMSR